MKLKNIKVPKVFSQRIFNQISPPSQIGPVIILGDFTAFSLLGATGADVSLWDKHKIWKDFVGNPSVKVKKGMTN